MRVALLGDIALYGRYSVGASNDVCAYFSDAADHLSSFDYVVGNLETPFASGLSAYGAKSAYISADPRSVTLLRLLNVNVVNVANNHIFDYGAAGYSQTLELLDKNGIRAFGMANAEVILADRSATVALHGYCSYNTNPLGIARGAGIGVNPLNIRRVEDRLRFHDDEGRLNIISIHSGQEHVNFPSRDDMRMARKFARICPYVYYGHHPHVVQGVEVVDGSLIAYSLGNFCFDDVYTSKSAEPLVRQSQNNREGLIVELEIDGNRLSGYRLTPVCAAEERLVIGGDGLSEKFSRYSEALTEPEVIYERKRSALICDYIGSRKKQRNLSWYLKRMNFDSVRILAKAKYNAWQYHRNVRALLDARPGRSVCNGNAGMGTR